MHCALRAKDWVDLRVRVATELLLLSEIACVRRESHRDHHRGPWGAFALQTGPVARGRGGGYSLLYAASGLMLSLGGVPLSGSPHWLRL